MKRDDILSGGGKEAQRCQVTDKIIKPAKKRTSWKCAMVSDRRCKCKGRKTTYFLEVERECGGVKLWSRTTYSLNVEREHDEVRLWRWKQSEQGDVPPGSVMV